MPAPHSPSPWLSTDGGPLRVLIADDHADAVETLAMLISLEGHAVEVARNGLEALDQVARFHPHVSILDIGMPGLDGHAVARRIRQSADGLHMLILALTGRSEAEDKLRAHAAGFDEHFTKPVDPARLLQHIASWQHARTSSPNNT
ncbi:response regulator [Hydrogenophaga sp.]|uniref:response regulator n=1 Tax=Hydrogenophaga sp. TaxID=1904254 RepID=UPI0025BFAB5E|nr:response regulator [Hydrogenophaga sp.]